MAAHASLERTQLEVLSRISQALAHHHDVSAFLQETLGILEGMLGMERCTLTLRRPGTDILAIEASRGLTSAEKQRGQYRIGEGITGRAAATRQPAIIPDVTKEPAFLNRTGTRTNKAQAFLCVPIIRKDEVIGTLSADPPTAPQAALEAQAAFLGTIANLLAEAVAGMRAQVEEREALLAENRRLRFELGEQFRPEHIIGNCAAMRAIYAQIAQVADSPATVLIRGESGTGKELVARALHFGSTRRTGPFISVNVAALPEHLVESELFGHEKGAFTGALAQRRGRFEIANGGTLFLDEIGAITPAVQVRLLRVLQERVFERVGGNEPIHVNVRIVAATSEDLEAAMAKDRFREDLYYRLNVFPLHLPPLRNRRSDLMLLADFFLGKYNQLYNKNLKRISSSAINMMMSYHWPGNVRELESCIERAVLTSQDDVVHGFNLPPSLQTAKATHTEFLPGDEGVSLKVLLASYEREIMIDALKQHSGNCAAAARYLQTTARIFNYRARKLRINPDDFKV